MFKRLFIALILSLPLFALGQVTSPPANTVVAPSASSNVNSVNHRWVPKVGSYWYELLTLQDSVLFSTRWWVNHADHSTTGNWTMNGRFAVTSHYGINFASDSTFKFSVSTTPKFNIGSGLAEVFGIFYQSDFGLGFKNTNKANGSGKRIMSFGYNMDGLGPKWKIDTGLTSMAITPNQIIQRDSTTGHYRLDSIPNFNHSINIKDRLLTSSDTGTTALPSLYNLEHRDWNFYNPVTFHQNVDMTGAEIHNALLYQVGDAYGDPTKSVNIQNFGGTFQVSRSTTAGFTLDPVTNRLFTAGSGGAGPGIPYMLGTDVAIPTVEQLGGAVGNNVTDDAAAFATATATGKNYQLTTGKRYKISAAFTLNAGQKIYGNGATIVINHTHAIDVADSVLIDNIRFVGSGKGSFNVNEIAIYDKKHKGITISNCVFDSLAYTGVYGDSTVNQPGSGNINYKGNRIINPTFYNSRAGVVFGKRGEYFQIINPVSQGCDTAVVNAGGNNSIVGGIFDYNGWHIFLKNGGSNDSHSYAVGATFNHAINYAIRADSITYDYNFDGCTFLASQLYFNNSKEVVISNSIMSPRTSSLGITNVNSRLILHDNLMQSSIPYTESGAAPYNNFYNNILAYNNVTVTAAQFTIDSARYSLSRPAKSGIVFATDANTTITTGDNIIELPTPTASRTLTLPSALVFKGRGQRIWNKNTSTSFSWTFATTVKDNTGATITTIPNLSWAYLLSDGINWNLISPPNQTQTPILATTYANMVTLFTADTAVSQLFFVVADEQNGGGYPAMYAYAYNSTDAAFRLIRFIPQLAN